MADAKSIYKKAKLSPHNISFKELCYLVENIGFNLKPKKSGSHRIYKHSHIKTVGLINIQNVKGKAKPYQVRQVLDKIEQYKLI